MTTFDAVRLSRGWLSVALASAPHGGPVLDRTVCVEQHDRGIRLIATDTYLLLTAWVSGEGFEDEPEPELGETPDTIRVCADHDSRGRNLAQYVHTLATAKGAPDYTMTVRDTRLAAGDGQGMFDGMAGTAVALEFPGVEKVTLGCVDAPYPDWRKTMFGFTGKRTDAVALHAERLNALAKLGKLHGCPLLWYFGGRDRPARVEVADSVPFVSGLVMPVRWDLERAMPADDTPPDADAV